MGKNKKKSISKSNTSDQTSSVIEATPETKVENTLEATVETKVEATVETKVESIHVSDLQAEQVLESITASDVNKLETINDQSSQPEAVSDTSKTELVEITLVPEEKKIEEKETEEPSNRNCNRRMCAIL